MEQVAQVSVFRLRLGVVMIGIFWIPIWLLAPVVAGLINEPVGTVTLVIGIIQTIIGLLGALVAGRQAAAIVKHTKKRKVPGKIWHVIWTGKLEAEEAPPLAVLRRARPADR